MSNLGKNIWTGIVFGFVPFGVFMLAIVGFFKIILNPEISGIMIFGSAFIGFIMIYYFSTKYHWLEGNNGESLL